MKNIRNRQIILTMTIMLFLLTLETKHIFFKSGQVYNANTTPLLNPIIDNQNLDGPAISVAGHPVALWPQEESYYAFLPAACKDNAHLLSDLPEGIDVSSIYMDVF